MGGQRLCLSCCPSDHSSHIEATLPLNCSQPITKCSAGPELSLPQCWTSLRGNFAQRLFGVAKTFSELPSNSGSSYPILPFALSFLAVGPALWSAISTYFYTLFSSSFTSTPLSDSLACLTSSWPVSQRM